MPIKITCISDTHGAYPKLDVGDLLIVAGDLTARDTWHEYVHFEDWLSEQKYEKIVVVAGNHDGCIQKKTFTFGCAGVVDNEIRKKLDKIIYLEDSGCELDFDGQKVKIWGSPWSKNFCDWYFMMNRDALEKHWNTIPIDTDIIVTHSPAYGILDKISPPIRVGGDTRGGCRGLLKRVKEIKPKLFVCGHIHEGYGIEKFGSTVCVNASLMNEHYRQVNEPFYLEI